ESLSAGWGMHVRRIAGQQHALFPVGYGLPRRIGEPRAPRDAVNAEIRPVGGDERLPKLVEARLVALAELRLGHHTAHALAVLQLAQGNYAPFTVADARRRLVGHLAFEDDVADGWIPSREIDACLLADKTA